MYDVIIIGCGVIGAAAAFALAKTNAKVLILEAENDVAAGTTKANSAILHAGYDPEPGTLMARLNVEGVAMAKEICQALDVPRKECGSLVLAFSNEEAEHVKKLYDRGNANGVPGLEILTGEEVRRREPNLSEAVVSALWAPSAAIVSPWEFALAMVECAVNNGAKLLRNAKVTELHQENGMWQVTSAAGTFTAPFVINAAGLGSQKIHELAAQPSFQLKPCRGQYYLLDKSEGSRVHSVIFQCPTKAGKGILVAPTVHGNCIVGPSAEAVEGDNTATTADSLAGVAAAARKSVPNLDLGASIRCFAGVRANSDQEDFIIAFAAPGLLDLAGIKSPGLSAAPAIGEEAVKLLKEQGLQAAPRVDFQCHRRRIRFKELSTEEKNAMIAADPSYGRVICRCETITEGEILASLRTPIPPLSVDAVKRRCNAGMGRCQGGFCGPRVVEILSRELGLQPEEILQEKSGSQILVGKTKGVQ